MNLTIDSLCEPPLDLKIALYRIAQEALNNIAKYAQAGQVEIALRCDEDRTELSVGDDGKGFDPNAIPAGHLGVRIMYERAAEVGAQLDIESEPGEGTWVRVVREWEG